MGVYETALLAGAALGLASSLHCGAMCGGICASTLTLLNPHRGAQRAVHLAATQAGRVTTYVTLGVMAGAASAPFAPDDGAYSLKLVQWAAAVSLMWVGLSMAGVLPVLTPLDRMFRSLGHHLESATRIFHGNRLLAPYAVGLIWGASTCPILYGALISAMFTGSAVAGGVYMLGFGLGTVPAVAASGWAVASVRRVRSPSLQSAAGLAIAAAGFLSVYIPWPAVVGLCVSIPK